MAAIPYAIAVSDARGEAYVANDGSVSVVSLLSHRQVAEVKTGFQDQTSIGLARAGTRAYIGTFDPDPVVSFDTERRAVRGRVTVGRGATAIVSARTPAGEYAYVALETARRLAVIRTADDHVVRRASRSPPARRPPPSRPEGTQVWAGSAEAGTVWVVDTATQRRVRTLSVKDAGPVSSIAFTPDGTRALVYGLAGVAVIDRSTGHELTLLPITRLFPRTRDLNAGPIAMAADGAEALVVNATFPDTPARGSVAVLDTRTLRVTRRVATGTEPVGLAVDPARDQVYVANYADDTISWFGLAR